MIRVYLVSRRRQWRRVFICNPTVYGHEALYKDFLDALGENSEPLVNGFAGLKIILAVYKSQKTGLQVKFKNFIDFLF